MLVPLLILGWCFVVGACVGSFLNVVAWRLPNGMSLSWPGSHCPQCKKLILLRDNVPVFGWLGLRGRCRSCGVKISPRYPVVEFITGTAFAALAFVELAGGGENLPGAALDGDGSAFYSLNSLLYVWIYHSVFTALLIVTALFERDGARIPRRFISAGLLFGLVPPLFFWPELQPMALVGAKLPTEPAWLTPLVTGFVGLTVGAVIGWIVNWGWNGGRGGPMAGCGYVMLVLALVGAFLGWQAALTTACATALLLSGLRLAGLIVGHTFAYPAAVTACLAIMHILIWRPLTELSWPGTYVNREQIGITGAVIVVASMALAAIERLRPTIPTGTA
jgi:leader peptidase (prepilin peptidase)/N-methyltransferase